MSTVHLEPLKVLCVVAPEGVAGAATAFERLEGALPTLRGRKFYGVLDTDGTYRACVACRDQDVLPDASLLSWTIAGGAYVRTRINDWSTRIPEIARTFAAMAAEHPRDASRPSIEYYRSERELILLLPIVG